VTCTYLAIPHRMCNNGQAQELKNIFPRSVCSLILPTFLSSAGGGWRRKRIRSRGV